jgi:hypothetical protein
MKSKGRAVRGLAAIGFHNDWATACGWRYADGELRCRSSGNGRGFSIEDNLIFGKRGTKICSVYGNKRCLGPSLGLMLATSGGAALPPSSSEQDNIKNAHSNNVFATFRSDKEKIVFIIEICFETKAKKSFYFLQETSAPIRGIKASVSRRL